MTDLLDDRHVLDNLREVFRADVQRAEQDLLEQPSPVRVSSAGRHIGVLVVGLVVVGALAIALRSPLFSSLSSIGGAGSSSGTEPSGGSPTAPASPTQTLALIGGLPTNLNGLPVLRGDDALTAFRSANPGQELQVGGWLSAGQVLSCPVLRPGEWWNPCLAIGLHETSANGPLIFVYPGPSPIPTPKVEAGFTQPIVFSVHTGDASCPTDNLDCHVLPVIDSVAWIGAVVPVPTNFGPAPSGGLTRADAVDTARASAKANSSGPLTLVSAQAGPYGIVGPSGSDVRADRWVWAVFFTGQFPAPDCADSACLSQSTFLVVLDYQSGDVLIEESPA
ncbi:MAG: hypothetical protein FIA92_01325 [Chloroflexi bacterium]|nr:hypothetical protein [Chloroflexota bacterium]